MAETVVGQRDKPNTNAFNFKHLKKVKKKDMPKITPCSPKISDVHCGEEVVRVHGSPRASVSRI
jgi:hypothetical protein